MRLTTLETVAAILLALSGTGGTGAGFWKLAAAITRRARAIEQSSAQAQAGLQTCAEAIRLLTGLAASHQLRLDQLHPRTETTPWTHPPPDSAGAATPADHGLPPPVSTPTR